MTRFENATPRPWTKYDVPGSPNVELHAKQGPITVCPAIAHGKDDGELVFRAVNSHEALVDALEELLGLDDIREASGLIVHRMPAHVRKKAQAALKLARGEQS